MTAIPTPARSPMLARHADGESAGATTEGGHRAPDRGGSSTARTAARSGDTVPHVVAGRPDPSIR
jgi:hypothetical protein